MKGFLAGLGFLVAIAAIILSIAGWRHIVILGLPVGISAVFWIGYILYKQR